MSPRRSRQDKREKTSGPSLRDPWTEHPALVKSEAGREIARLRAMLDASVEETRRLRAFAKSKGGSMSDPDLSIGSHNDYLDIWTIYDHPRDFPEKYVGRLHVVGRLGSGPTDHVIVADTLEEIRATMMAKGLSCLTRRPNDDPVIVEVWL